MRLVSLLQSLNYSISFTYKTKVITMKKPDLITLMFLFLQMICHISQKGVGTRNWCFLDIRISISGQGNVQVGKSIF